MRRFPDDVAATAEDFRRSEWRTALASQERDGYSEMWSALSCSAKKAAEDADLPKAKVLWLLADACSMMLKPESLNEPFKPFAIMEGKRSALPEDFDAESLALFSEILEEVDDIWLKARLADLLWLCLSPRQPVHALAAVDSYRSVPIDADTWIRDGRECWQRAVRLAQMLKAEASERLVEMERTLLAAFDAATPGDGFFALWLARLLAELKPDRDDARGVANNLERMARVFREEGGLSRSRDYYDAASEWHRTIGDHERVTETTIAVAECWEAEAQAQGSSERPSHTVAASFFESAIQTYRRIPRSERPAHRVDERIAELHRRMTEARQKSLGEMGTISTEAIDLTDIVERARESVRGKSTMEALAALANITRVTSVSEGRRIADENLRKHPLHALFSAVHLSQDGRVVARTHAMDLGDSNSEAYQAAVWSEMIRHYTMEIGLNVPGCIWPALGVLTLEHRLREYNFVSLARQSPIVPPDREQLFGKALFAGVEGDFATAIHLLTPQLEHMVRWHLKAAGTGTTSLDPDGIEREKGLTALLKGPSATDVFGDEIPFELNALFCDPIGPNLRNKVAHGLLDDSGSQSVYTCYAWWLGLRLVFKTFWNAARMQPAAEPEG